MQNALVEQKGVVLQTKMHCFNQGLPSSGAGDATYSPRSVQDHNQGEKNKTMVREKGSTHPQGRANAALLRATVRESEATVGNSEIPLAHQSSSGEAA